MHSIQQYILSQLILKQNCRYRDIKPKDVEGNLFMYHLRALIELGLVKKEGLFYVLTPAGLRYADQLSLKTLTPRIQPKIVTLIACQNDRGEWLMYERTKQPFRGYVGFPYGKIHLGEKVAEAAQRELTEKTGLAGQLTHRGEAYVTAYVEGTLISHLLFHVFSCSQVSGALDGRTEIGRCFWAKPDLGATKLIPGFLAIYNELVKDSRQPFFIELVENLTAN